MRLEYYPNSLSEKCGVPSNTALKQSTLSTGSFLKTEDCQWGHFIFR